MICRCVVPSFQRMKTSVLLRCWKLEPSLSWHTWLLQREQFVFWLGEKAEWFCSFWGFFLCLKTSHGALNLKRLNLLDRDLCQKTVGDLLSKSGRKQLCFSIPQTMGEIQVCCVVPWFAQYFSFPSIGSGFLLPRASLAARSILSSAAPCCHGKNYIHVIYLTLASLFWVVPPRLTRVLYWATWCCTSAGAEYEGMPVVQETALGRFTTGSFSGNHGYLHLPWREAYFFPMEQPLEPGS